MRKSKINVVSCVVLANELWFCIASFASGGKGSIHRQCSQGALSTEQSHQHLQASGMSC